jgi:hypothetical protein
MTFLALRTSADGLVIELRGQNLYAWGSVRKRRIFFGQFEQFVDAF